MRFHSLYWTRTPLVYLSGIILAGACAPVVGADQIASRIPVDLVWAGHPVGFALLTDAERQQQYVGYYNADRAMVIAVRDLDSNTWTKQILPSKLGWDSHNAITFALDRDGQLHVAGNMHSVPLIYFRTTRAGDVSSLVAIPTMADERIEQKVTYPRFLIDHNHALFFSYRDGSSGRGNNFINRYDEKTRAWLPILDTPLFDGQRPPDIPRPDHDKDDKMNAYPVGPMIGPDGFWHMTWVWRDTYHAETNHDLSYARSRDLIHWETFDGRAITLPISIKTPGVIIDPIPAMGGTINGSGQFGFDQQGRIIVSYHKFDSAGATQIYLATPKGNQWLIRQITHWTYRWYPEGGGSLQSEVAASPLHYDSKIGHYISFRNAHEKGGTFLVEPDTLSLGESVPADLIPDRLPAEVRKGIRPGLQMRITHDLGDASSDHRFLLRWETQAANRDRAYKTPIPAPSQLELIQLKGTSGKSR